MQVPAIVRYLEGLLSQTTSEVSTLVRLQHGVEDLVQMLKESGKGVDDKVTNLLGKEK